MVMQTGLGFSKIIILVGAGYTSTLLLNNGKFSDLLGELQALVKGYEGKQGDGAEGDYADAIVGQVHRLAMEVRQLASARQIAVFICFSNSFKKHPYASYLRDVTSLMVPAAALGTVGYGYMWWKGLSFSDIMFVTKRNITNAVSNLTNHLEQVSDALTSAKRHLTQRIEKVDGKLDEQVEMSKAIRNEVTDVHDNLSQIGYDLDSLDELVSGMNGKMTTLEEKQDFAIHGVQYLCYMFEGNLISSKAEEQCKLAAKSFGGYVSAGRKLTLEGVKAIPDILDSGDVKKLSANGDKENHTLRLENHPRMLTRKKTVKLNV